MNRRGIGRLAVRLVGPVLLGLVLWKLGDPAKIWATLSGAALGPLALAIALNIGPIHLKVWRWRVLLKSRGCDYPWGRAYRAFLPSLYLGLVTPGRVGDALRIQYVKREKELPYAEGLAVIVMDRFCDMYTLLGFVAVAIAHFASVIVGKLAWITWAGVAVTALAPLVLLVPGLAEKLMGRVYAKLSGDGDGLDRFLTALRGQLGRPLLAAVPLTIAAFLVNYAQGWLAARAIGLELSMLDVSCMLAITSLLGLLPVSVSGVGVRELFLALLFPALGLAQDHGVAFGLAVFVVIYLSLVVIGFAAWQVSPPPFALTQEKE